MRNFFDIDGPLIEGLTKVADIVILNLLFIVCSIPIITIGASWTAMYYVTLKMVKNEECYIVKSFFRSFKQNFKQATVIWLIMLFIGFILYFDVKVMGGEYGQVIAASSGVAKVMSVLLMAATVFYLLVISYVFPVLSRFDNTIKNTMKNALLMSIKHFPLTIVILVVILVPLAIVYMNPRLFILIFVIFGLIAYITSYSFVKIFKNYMPNEGIADDNEFEIKIEDDNK